MKSANTLKVRISIEFDGNWVLSRQNDALLPIDNIKKLLSDKYRDKAFFEDESLTELTLTLPCSAKAAKTVAAIVSEQYNSDEEALSETENGVTRYAIGDFAVVSVESANDDGEAAVAVLDTINALTGWDEYKALCREIYSVSPEIKKHNTYDSFLFQNYLFSVNDGCGLTTALRLFAVLSEALGLFEFNKRSSVKEITLVSNSEENKYTPEDALEFLKNDENSGMLVCFEIGEYITKSKANELKQFLTQLVELENKYIFAFSVPFIEPDALENFRNILSDVLYVRVVSVPPFTNEQLRSSAENGLAKYGYKTEQTVWNIFYSRLSEEKSDGKFYGLQSVNKIVYEMLWKKHKADSLSENAEETDNLITCDEVIGISPSYSKERKNGFDELSELVGMEEISAKLKEIVAQVKLTLNNDKMERPCLHMRFTGAPGTGKTTVARLVGKIFAENGILRNGYFFEYSARDLCGKYVGQTAPKTSAICRDAYGSVLFIDEAYALYTGNDRNTDYGREALTTLISEMENHRDDMVVVMAGYSEDMNKLMEGNIGLRSRMPFLLEFPSYTSAQLFEIYMLMVKKHFDYEPSLEQEAKKYFDSLTEDYMKSQDFANARFARNLYERTWSKGAVRAQLNETATIVLNGDDFIKASSEKEFSEKIMTKRNIGFASARKEN